MLLGRQSSDRKPAPEATPDNFPHQIKEQITVGFAEVLTAIFIVLKLTHVIDWSWWWIVSPELVSVGFIVLFILGALGVVAKTAKSLK